ncbi:DUF1254 domain-containing protein [Bosea lathyri]|jgi:uncharacterized membrane protein|uniref:Uncharacterized membrane protein n=1 Tax=Bosea lathyri TaxID=1036778 RepID=A0A1H5TJW3_9HYPH|nr:hypothetical protein [Bosea lathyri]SEF63080.1 Uncharacterized membrane protein [Bosea lathyri]
MSAIGHDPTDMAATPRPERWRSRIGTVFGRFVLATIAGLVLAGIVHIVTILLIPILSERDANTAYRMLGSGGRAELLPSPGGTRDLPPLREADPAAVTAVCSYDLSAGPMRVVARAGSLPLGLTLHRRGGGVLYAITDRAAIRGVVEFLVMTEEQRDERIAQDDDGEVNRELRIVSDTAQGLIVARVLAKRPSDRADAEALATGVACGMAN